VNDPLRVAIGDRVEDVPDDVRRDAFAVVSLGALRLGNDPIEEFPTGAQFRHQVQIFLVLEDVDQLDDVRVLDLLEDLDLGREDLDFLYLGLSDRFDGVPAVRFPVHAFPHDPVVTVAEFLRVHVVLDSHVGQRVGDLYEIVGIGRGCSGKGSGARGILRSNSHLRLNRIRIVVILCSVHHLIGDAIRGVGYDRIVFCIV